MTFISTSSLSYGWLGAFSRKHLYFYTHNSQVNHKNKTNQSQPTSLQCDGDNYVYL